MSNQPETAKANTAAQFESALREQVEFGCPGVVLTVSAPNMNCFYSGACGLFARDSARKIAADDAFRVASVTKAVTAATAVRLAAMNRWGLDDSVADMLPRRLVEGISALDGLISPDALTPRILLSHASGIPDYFFDKQFQDRVKADPERIWQPEELVEAALETGHVLFPPGKDFSYGDTGYVLVGIAIERLLDRPLHEIYRELIFNPLNMNATFLEWRDSALGQEIAHHYDGEKDLHEKNLSFDWAGGGLVSTASDLVKFIHGLFDGQLFAQRWIREMITWRREISWRPHSSARYMSYGLGLGTNVAYGQEIIGATGVWGAFAYYWPTGGAAIAGTLNMVGADRASLMDAIVRTLTSKSLGGDCTISKQSCV
jgi:D-alanyl-D-alanine carboxypeptidase